MLRLILIENHLIFMMILTTIGFLFIWQTLISNVIADYVLILELKDIANGLFSSSIRSTGLENENNPAANTYSIIGNLDPNYYNNQLNGAYYQFKIVYKYHDIGLADDVITWTQTSWLTEPGIAGFANFNSSSSGTTNCPTYIHPCSCFRGLGLSDYTTASYFDGTGTGDGCWWNSIGSIALHDGGIPAFNQKIAYYQALYIFGLLCFEFLASPSFILTVCFVCVMCVSLFFLQIRIRSPLSKVLSHVTHQLVRF